MLIIRSKPDGDTNQDIFRLEKADCDGQERERKSLPAFEKASASVSPVSARDILPRIHVYAIFRLKPDESNAAKA